MLRLSFIDSQEDEADWNEKFMDIQKGVAHQSLFLMIHHCRNIDKLAEKHLELS